MKTATISQWYQILRQHYQFTVVQAVRGALTSSRSARLGVVIGEIGMHAIT